MIDSSYRLDEDKFSFRTASYQTDEVLPARYKTDKDKLSFRMTTYETDDVPHA